MPIVKSSLEARCSNFKFGARWGPAGGYRIALLDEKAARAVAMEIGLQVTGFPGILARAGADGLVTKADIHRLLKSCQRQGTHYSDALIAHVAGVYAR